MPKLILFIVCLVIFTVFAALNTQSVHINYVFGKGDVALIVALVISFTLGVLFTLPIAFLGRSKAAKRAEQREDAKTARSEKKTPKRAQTQKSSDADYPELDPASDELIKEKLGMESPREKILLR